MNTRHKGNIAVANAIGYFSENGCSVFLPVGDSGGAIDLVVSYDGLTVKRVQCKYTTRFHEETAKRYPDSLIWKVHITRQNQVIYDENSFDLLFVTTPDGNYLINWKEYVVEKGKISSVILIGKKLS